MLRFLIVDDHEIFRQGVKNIISQAFPNAEFGEAGDSAQAYSLIVKQLWDIIILDINLPGRSGLELINDLGETVKGIPILILTMYSEDQLAMRALKSGAMGYLTKSHTSQNLIEAITRLLAGLHFINDHVSSMLVNENKMKNIDLLEQLSDREYFTMKKLVSGQSVSEISRALSLSVKTISTYRSRLFKKLNIKNQTELIHFAQEHNLEERD
ncbi:MAG: response regulator transcription factor [Bacteroidota bacterium]